MGDPTRPSQRIPIHAHTHPRNGGVIGGGAETPGLSGSTGSVAPFIGARVGLSSAFTITSANSAVISGWTTSISAGNGQGFDHGGFFSAADDGFKIPAQYGGGLFVINIQCIVNVPVSQTGYLEIYTETLNGPTGTDYTATSRDTRVVDGMPANAVVLTAPGGPYKMITGETVRCTIYNVTGANRDVAATDGTWFSIQFVGFSA